MVYFDDEGCSKDPRYVKKWFKADLKNCLGTVDMFHVYFKYKKLWPEMAEMLDEVFDKYYPNRTR